MRTGARSLLHGVVGVGTVAQDEPGDVTQMIEGVGGQETERFLVTVHRSLDEGAAHRCRDPCQIRGRLTMPLVSLTHLPQPVP
ncbi:MAG TPA: hypothetical protein VIK32_13205 [Candidatus Limnocylindrales bacterium]